MNELQELITRGRYIFSGAPRRKEVFNLMNGKNSGKDIAKKTGRSLSSVLHDMRKLQDLELIIVKEVNGKPMRKDDSVIYVRSPLIRHVSQKLFNEIANTTRVSRSKIEKASKNKNFSKLHIPTTSEIIDICKNGETQLYEFKEPGVKIDVLSEEIAAFLHTKKGGFIFYGVDDDGKIVGSDQTRQNLDQRIQNSVRGSIDPPPHIEIIDIEVLGSKIILIIIPPWDKRSLYQYTPKGRFMIRKGTSKFPIKTEEMKKLTQGKFIT